MHITARDTDARLSHIDAEPYSGAHAFDPALLGQRLANRRERLVELGCIGAAALREIVFPAAAPAEDLCADLGERPCLGSGLTCCPGGRGNHERFACGFASEHDNRCVIPEALAHLLRELSNIVG